MVAGDSSPRPGADRFDGESDAQTPAIGIPVQQPPPAGADDLTPPAGIEGLSDLVTAEDFGQAGPAVFGAEERPETGSGEAKDWPTLEYRSRNKPQRSGGFDFLRRKRDSN